MTDSLFYILAGLLVFFSLLVVHLPNLIHSAVALIASFFVTAALYLLMQMEFVAVAQVMVYIGGIVIFVVMTILLTTRLGEVNRYPTSTGRLLGATGVSASLLAFFLSVVLTSPEQFSHRMAAGPDAGSLEAIGLRLLATDRNGFIVPFEIISILLFIALVGAVVIARRENGLEGDRQ